MAKNVSSVSIGLFGNVGQFVRAFGTQASGAVTGFVGHVTAAGSKLAAFTGLAGAVSGSFAAIAGIGSGFKLASDSEQASVAMEVMLGSATAAQKVMSDLTDFAASTPFEFPELVTSARKLLAFGVSTEKLMPSLSAIGDIASGVGATVAELAELFGKARVQGTLYAEDINQLVGRGIPVIQEFAKQLGVSESQVKKMASEGKISFSNLEQAFASLTGKGGKFAGLMEKQSGTLGGLFSTLKDTVGLTLRQVAETIISTFNLKGAMTSLIKNGSAISDYFVGLVQRVAPAIKSIAGYVYSTFATAYTLAAPILSRMAGVVSNVFGAVAGVVKTVGAQVWGVVSSVWGAVYGYVAPIVSSVYQTISSNWTGILSTTVGVFTGVWGFVSGVWEKLAGAARWVGGQVSQAWDYWTVKITGDTATTADAVLGSFNRMGRGAGWLSGYVSDVFSLMSFAIRNWEQTAALIGTKVMLGFVKFGNGFTHVFGTVVPAVAAYVWDVLKTTFSNVYNYTTTVFGNIGRNIVSIMSNLPGLISGSVSFSDLWRPLEDGFQVAVAQGLKIPERVQGNWEKQLGIDIEIMEGKFADNLGNEIAKKREQAEKAAKGIGQAVNEMLAPQINDKTLAPPKVEAPVVPPVKLDASLNQDTLALGIKPEIKRASALRVGSAESQLAGFVTATAAPAKPVPSEVKAQTTLAKQQVDESKKQTDLLRVIATKDSGTLQVANF